MSLDSAIQHLLAAKRISAPSQSYAKDNPGEWEKVKAYLEGGARPTGVVTEMGLGLIEVEDARRPDPTPVDEIWHRFVVADWPNLHKGSESTITNSTFYPPPPGAPTENWIRYFLKDGSLWNNTERCEGSNDHGPPPFVQGDTVRMVWWLLLEQFPVYAGEWNIVAQAHLAAGGTQPCLIFAFDADRKLKFKTSKGGGHTQQWQSLLPIPLEFPIKIDVGVKFSADASGWVDLRIDDVEVLPQKSAVTLDSSAGTAYWKQGLYRSASVTGDAILHVNGMQAFSG